MNQNNFKLKVILINFQVKKQIKSLLIYNFSKVIWKTDNTNRNKYIHKNKCIYIKEQI